MAQLARLSATTARQPRPLVVSQAAEDVWQGSGGEYRSSKRLQYDVRSYDYLPGWQPDEGCGPCVQAGQESARGGYRIIKKGPYG
jgi:hypothetical protein